LSLSDFNVIHAENATAVLHFEAQFAQFLNTSVEIPHDLLIPALKRKNKINRRETRGDANNMLLTLERQEPRQKLDISLSGRANHLRFFALQVRRHSDSRSACATRRNKFIWSVSNMDAKVFSAALLFKHGHMLIRFN